MKATIGLLPMALVTFCLCAPAAQAQNDLWEAVYDLNHKVRGPAAADKFREAGQAGLDTLLKVVRLSGNHLVFREAAKACGCNSFVMGNSTMMPFMPTQTDQIADKASQLIGEFLAAEPTQAERLLDSAIPFERKMGLVGLIAHPDSLIRASDKLSTELEPAVVEAGRAAVRCALRQPGLDKDLSQRLSKAVQATNKKRETMLPAKRCTEPGFAAGIFLEGLASGIYQVNGWQSSNNKLSVRILLDDGTVSLLAPPCALSLYAAAARQDKYFPGLIRPFYQTTRAERDEREQAIELALRDLDKISPKKRNDLAVDLVNAGVRVSFSVTYDQKRPFAQEDKLEAAARQGDKQALESIEQAVFCRGTSFSNKRIALLGYLKTGDAADQAYEIANRCPRARMAATIALLRLGDDRAKETLGPALDESSLMMDQLTRAVAENYDRRLDDTIKKLAGQRGGHKARNILNYLKKMEIALP